MLASPSQSWGLLTAEWESQKLPLEKFHIHTTHTKLATAVGEHAPGMKVSWPHAWIFSFSQGHTVCERWGLNTSTLPFYDWSNQFIFIVKILKQNMRLLKSLGWPSYLILTLFLSCFRALDGYRPQPTNSARKDKVLMRSNSILDELLSSEANAYTPRLGQSS